MSPKQIPTLKCFLFAMQHEPTCPIYHWVTYFCSNFNRMFVIPHRPVESALRPFERESTEAFAALIAAFDRVEEIGRVTP